VSFVGANDDGINSDGDDCSYNVDAVIMLYTYAAYILFIFMV